MRNHIDLINGPIGSTLRKFAIPIGISFMINMLYSWVDLYYISYIGDNAVGAMGVSERIWFFIFSIASGFSMGSSIIIARRFGENNRAEANHIATQSTVFMFFIGLIIAIAIYLFLPQLLTVMGIKGEVKYFAIAYFSGLALGIPFNFMIFHMNLIIRSSGNSFYPMLILISSNVLNAMIAPLFIFGIGPFPNLGIYGAGLGTAIAQFLGFIIGIIILSSNLTPLKFNIKKWILEFDAVKRIAKLGLPASLQMAAVSVTSMGLAANANHFGTNILTTYVLGLRIDLLVNMAIIAFGSALEIVTSQNLGAKKMDRIFLFYKSGVKQLSLLMIFLGIIIFFFGYNMARIFTTNPIIINEIHTYLRFTSFSYIPFAIGILSIRVISGGGDYVRSLIIVAGVLIGFQLPLSFALSNLFQHQTGIWIAQLTSMLVFAMISYWQMNGKKWLSIKV